MTQITRARRIAPRTTYCLIAMDARTESPPATTDAPPVGTDVAASLSESQRAATLITQRRRALRK